jgi:site-specific DNA recombinase
MNAAIYARKSNEQKGVSDDAKSVTRQVDNALAYAATKGWTVNAAHIFVDDGISGAEFEKRPGFMRLMATLPRPPFSRLIVNEQKSIGREMNETAFVIKQLDEAGVTVWTYTEDRCLTPRSSIDKMMANVQGFADEDHREKSSQRVTEAHTRLHKAGHVTGGRVFGYRNQDVCHGTDAHGRPLRSHVERVIDPIEAAVVKRIFNLYDSGYGLKRIAKLLVSEGAATPHHFRAVGESDNIYAGAGLRPANGWSPSTVRAVLTRTTYHGEIIWNKTRKKNAWGKRAVTDRPPSEWLRTTAEHLRIIDEPLWQKVAARRSETEGKAIRFASGRISGRPPKHATINLLAGLATCGVCGGGLVIEHSNNRKGHYSYYICHRRRTSSTCTNRLRMPIDEMNEAVLQAVEEHALTPEAIEQVILLTERDDFRDQQITNERERKDIDRRIERLVAAIETGGDAVSLVAKLQQLEARKQSISATSSGLRPVPRLAPAIIEDRLAEWRRLLRQSTTQGRTVLQRILRGRLTFTPRCNEISGEVDGYDFEGPTRFDKLFSGVACIRPDDLVPGEMIGCENISPDEMGDTDYGRLLEAAYAAHVSSGGSMRKGSRARQDSNLRPPA